MVYMRSDFVDYRALGEKIRKERNNLQLTQEKLAEKLDISESFLGLIERGERKLSIETLVKVSNELNVSIDYLLFESRKIVPNVVFDEVSTILETKKPEQVKRFLKLLKIIANTMDEWV
jgi:transcriptional regulator with XRE-family HTH domain